MPVGRIVLKSISESKKLAELSTDGARLLDSWLLLHVDVNGCFSADPLVIKGRVFTRLNHTIETIKNYLSDLSQKKLIVIYVSNGDTFLQIPDFQKKQPYLNPSREAKPTIPLPTQEQLQSNSGVVPDELLHYNKSKSKSKSKLVSVKTKKQSLQPRQQAVDRRNPQVQEVMDYATTKKFAIQGSREQNRKYAWLMIRRKVDDQPMGVEGVKQLIDAAAACRNERYAPQVNDFVQLFKRWQDLLAFVGKKLQKQKGRIG